MRREVAPATVALLVCSLLGRPALGLQPLTEFLAHAKEWNPQNRAAHATTALRAAEVGISTGALLPNFSATGMYTRNQYEVTTAALLGSSPTPSDFPNIVIQPANQFDANLILNVPLIDVANWDRRAAAKATLEGARADEASAQLAVEKNVVRYYYMLLGDQAVLSSAQRNLEVTQHNVTLARDRRQGGTGSELEVQRAIADQAKAEQNVTAAELSVSNTRQDLYSLSGLDAEPATTFPEDDLHDEAPLEAWTGKIGAVPAVQSAVASRVSAEENARAVKATLFPTISGMGEERFTNATAFIGGHKAVYLAQVSATWKVDTTISPMLQAQSAAVAAARANEDGARQAAEDAVFRDWQQIRADIDAAHSARAQVEATRLAASLAEDRYAGGVATQLDLLQARQDAFSADVARIQADADLAYARMALRLDAGHLTRGLK
jgi:outer membrane protein TolC